MIGETILHYKILEKLGEGGMGTVYKAQDTKLDRFVALKFLSSSISVSDDDKARFIQEAKAASAMNHPNVCTIYDIQDNEGQLFIVMEFVDGKTLKDKKGSFSEKQILEMGVQVAEGLSAAHEKGIVHRDIKPENIMIRKDGIAQIMDFGLAKLQSGATGSRLTKVGTTMGTMGYMSPEQVQGLDVDHRSDIFSFGVVLYEMFAGESPFKGMHETAIMYEIVNVDAPPLSTIKEGIDPELDEIILECLEKDKDDRYQSAKELAKDLRKIKKSSGHRKSRIYNVNTQSLTSPSGQMQISASVGPKVIRVFNKKIELRKIVLAASFLLIALIAVVVTLYFQPEPVREVRKFQWPYDYNFCVLSPDGKKIAYSKGEQLWIRRLDKIDPIEIKNVGTITNIFWSPNSEYIAYFTGLERENHQLRKVSANGVGNSLVVKTAPNYYPRFWGVDDSILVTSWDNTGLNTLLKVPSSGGELIPIRGGDSSMSTIKGNLTHVLGLPDGKTIILSDNTIDGRAEILLQTPEKRTVIYNGPKEGIIERPVYSTTGHILFPLSTIGNSPDIWAIPFDLSSLKISGNPFLAVRNADQISVSNNGMLFYIQVNASQGEQLELLSRSGKLLKVISPQQIEITSPSVSPDGNMVASMVTGETGKYDIWLDDMSKGTQSQLSFDVPQTWKPSWSPDGKQIVFQSGFFDSTFIYIQETNGLIPARPFIHTVKNPASPFWTADGRFILFSKTETVPLHQSDIWYFEIGKENSPKPLFETKFNEDFPYSSPDGRYVAYESDKSGQMEIYVTNFPEADHQWQISFKGGTWPQWVGDAIYFTDPTDNRLMNVKVKTVPDFKSANPEELFSGDSVGVLLQTSYSFFYTVTRDGKNIVAVKNNSGSTESNMVLVENWLEEIKNKN